MTSATLPHNADSVLDVPERDGVGRSSNHHGRFGELRASATALLAENDAGGYTLPSGRQYPHQWNWDSAFIALGLAQHDVARALEEIRMLLAGQWANGMVPHIVFHRPNATYFPDASFWATGSHHPAGIPTSGITQPPVVATALRTIAERTDIRPFLREAYPALVRWHTWFHTTRCVDGTALTSTLHPWESGTDDSPRWLDAMERIVPIDVPAYERVDLVHVESSHRPTNTDYDRYVHLVDLQRRTNWDQRVALATSPFCVQDVLTNAVLLRADEDLIWIGRTIGADTSSIEALREQALASFSERFRDDDRGLFLDYDVRASSSIPVNTAMTFVPLWAGIATDDQATRLLAHLRDPDEYWYEPGDGYLLTTCAKNEPRWSAVRYWRGPVWVSMNWFVHRGLIRYGELELANRVRRDTLALLERGGFVEYYNPESGEGCGARAFSWSASLALDLLNE